MKGKNQSPPATTHLLYLEYRNLEAKHDNQRKKNRSVSDWCTWAIKAEWVVTGHVGPKDKTSTSWGQLHDNWDYLKLAS